MLNYDQVWMYAVFTIVLIFLTYLFIKKKEFFAFDKNFSQLHFKDTFLFEIFFLSLHIITIILGLQAIGILLIGGFVIIPGCLARLYSTSFSQVIFFSSIISMISFLLGIHTSFLYPWIPTGPLCLLYSTLFFFLGFFLQPVLKRNA
jgi:manganese/zinc/iron transport system permease protein